VPENTIFKALADPTRRQILRHLNQGELTAGELSAHFQISAPSMSHHFNVLKQSGLVATRREGQRILYSLNAAVFEEILALVMEMSGRPAPDTEKST
jgi:DNA-binding transcriptional ArsR family regulator